MSTLTRNITRVFKPYLRVQNRYRGGKRIAPRQDGERVYKLSSNEHPFGTSPRVLEAIRNHARDLHLYPDATDERLRRALSAHFAGQVAPDQILTANSGSEILDLVFRAFLREGDEIIVSSPHFLQYSNFSAWMGARVVDVPLQGPSYTLNVPSILDALTERTRIIALTSPNNPTGTIIPRETLEELLDALPPDILVIYDEVYRHFTDDPAYTTALPYIRGGKPLLALNSFSKTYGMAALRVGYAYTTVEIADYIRQIIKPFSMPAISLEAALAALEDTDFVARTIELIRAERNWLGAQFDRLGLSYTPSQANFFLVDPPVEDTEFVRFLVDGGIMTRPVRNFGAPGKVRITIGMREANERLVAELEKLFQTIGN